mgnify:CR=1 FL=1
MTPAQDPTGMQVLLDPRWIELPVGAPVRGGLAVAGHEVIVASHTGDAKTLD